MKRKLLCVALGSLLVATVQASPAEPPQYRQDCSSLAEVALLARALAEEKIDKPRAGSILARMYEIPDERARRLARLVLESAYRDDSPADQFASKLEVMCRVTRGNMDSLLKAPPAGPRILM